MKGDYTKLLEGGLFGGNLATKTHVVFKKEEARRKKLKAEHKNYIVYPIHLFPAHPKAVYINKSGMFSDLGLNVAYTANYVRDYKADQMGERTCSEVSLSERTYIALMARAKIKLKKNPRLLDDAMLIFEKAIIPDIVERYNHLPGWNAEYVRLGVLRSCIDAMVEGFSVKIRGIDHLLFNIYEQTLAGNGRKVHKS